MTILNANLNENFPIILIFNYFANRKDLQVVGKFFQNFSWAMDPNAYHMQNISFAELKTGSKKLQVGAKIALWKKSNFLHIFQFFS